MLASNVVLLTVITAGVYFAGPLFEIAVAICTAVAVPDAMRGRVSSLLRLVELGSYSFGFFGTGMLLQYAGTVAAIILLSGLLLVLTVFAGLNSSFRAL